MLARLQPNGTTRAGGLGIVAYETDSWLGDPIESHLLRQQWTERWPAGLGQLELTIDWDRGRD